MLNRMHDPSIAVDLTYTGTGVDEEEDDVRVDFDVFGVARDPEKYRRIRSTGVLRYHVEDVS